LYWITYLYQYGVGGLVFALGLFLIVRSGSCDLTRRNERIWFIFLLVGYLWYAGLHLLWTLAALYL
jgi:hypothetical protein